MSSFNNVGASLSKHKALLSQELNETTILDVLVKKSVISYSDHEYITALCDNDKKCDYFIEILNKQTKVRLSELCVILEKECPKLIEELKSDLSCFFPNGYQEENAKESMVMEHNLNRESPRSRRSSSRCSCGDTTSRRSSIAFPPPPPPVAPPTPLNNTVEMYVEPVVEDAVERAGWETHRVRLNRVAGYGFGIAVSGGRDNPHFASGDPSIAVSDVLRGGPAEDKLQVNDRIVSVNGISLENVEYARAVQVLRESGNSVTLVVRRRAMVQPATHTVRATLTRPSKKEDFGIVLGCKLYIKELSMKARDQLTSAGQSLCEGDIITRINNAACTDNMTLKEAKKLLESCKDRLNLVVTREIIREETVNNGQNAYQNNYNSLGAETLSPSYSGQNLYVAAPSRSEAARNGRSQADGNEQPPRPPLPRNDDYYSRRQLYEEESTLPRSKASSEPRLISFQKEGSVGVRVSGGNVSGVFVSGVQAGSPAALQGLRPQDKILKVNEMEMKGVTREEAVLFLLSLQERIDLIVQHLPDEYHAVASGQCPGDSFHIRCHFSYTASREGEMSFKPGDVFHVTDTLHRGTVGAWQVARIGRNNQEVQKGIIPNKARAEELATAQFNASKKELNSSTDSRGNFFRRRRSTHRRSKSLGKEQWDEVVADMSRQEAYERVVLRAAPGPRPVLLLGAGAHTARQFLAQNHPTIFVEPQFEGTLEDNKSKSSGIIRLSNIRNVIERGKHPLLDVAPTAIEKLNYAQLYPIVIFVKVDNKATVKQLRNGLPKSAHKSSKKLLEASQQIERAWSHLFTHSITVTESTLHNWTEKLYDLIQRTQQQQIWVSEAKRSDTLSDDFLFPMSTTTENRLSYASSPESDLEVSPPPSGRLVKASSDPSVATTQDIVDRNDDLNHMSDGVPPPYSSPYGDSKYGFSSNGNSGQQIPTINGYSHSTQNSQHLTLPNSDTGISYHAHSPPVSPLYGTVPDLPPRVGGPPNGLPNGTPQANGINGSQGYHSHSGTPAGHGGTPGGHNSSGLGSHRPPGGVALPTPPRHALSMRQHSSANRPSAQERLFGTPNKQEDDYVTRVPPPPVVHNANSYDPMPPYDYGSLPGSNSNRLGPNAPDDLKVAPPPPGKMDVIPIAAHRNHVQHEHHNSLDYRHSDPNYRSSMAETSSRGRAPPSHARGPSLPSQGSLEHKYSASGNRAVESAASSAVGGYKPVPPPKPKHYRPPDTHYNGVQNTNGMSAAQGQDRPDGRGGGPYYWPHSHYQPQQQTNYQQNNSYGGQQQQVPPPPAQSPPYNGPPQQQHRALNLPHNPHLIDLAGSREQRGSAFELYRKPQHMHNMSGSDANASIEANPNITPKTKKKLTKKPSFIKNAVLDLFRSKSKNSNKVSRNKSVCEKDLSSKTSSRGMPGLRREKSDLSGASIHTHNTQVRNQMLSRSNSSCEKTVVKPILKRQSSFCDGRSGITCTITEYDTKPVIRNLRRQSSMSEIETEPKITPVLRRQNSLIEHNRRGVYVHSQQFNMITQIDPVYQRQQGNNHEPFHPTQPLPPEPCYQTKDHLIYDPIPKPRRTYAHNCNKTESPYGTSQNNGNDNYENPYSTRIQVKMNESPYATRSECMNENPYSTRHEQQSPRREPIYSESPYGSKEHVLKQRHCSDSPYSTKEEMLRQRFSESPYSTKEDMLKSRMENNFREPVYGSRTYEPPNPVPWTESPYGSRPESRRLQTPINYPGRISPMGKCMSEPPYASKTEIVSRANHSESPYSTRSEIKSVCSESPYASRTEVVMEKRPSSVECAYVSRQEILSQKAANKDPLYGIRAEIPTKDCGPKLEDKLEIIKQRNQAKKEMIYQSRREVLDGDTARIREPIYVSKRELKESIIYEAQNEGREPSANTHENSNRSSPYDLSDTHHLSRTPVSPVKSDSPRCNDNIQDIDFAALRLTDSKTDYEKEKSLELEAKVLKGEAIYTPRLPVKTGSLSDKSNTCSPTVPYESTTSMETNCVSEFSMNFDLKPQSTPYTSQDLENQANEIKQTRTVTFCDITEKSAENSETSINNETTVAQNDKTTMQSDTVVGASHKIVEPDGPHTTWGVFDSEGGILEDRQWGVSLIIPPKAIAPGVKQKIYFTVSDPRLSQTVGGPPIDMDNGEAMLSPLVMCGPTGLVFLRPVTLRLPHCANAVPSLGLTIKATDTEAHLSTDWDNYQLPTTTTLNTVAVKVDHF